MSFILDALRKSDARRRMGETPGLDNGPPPGPGGRRNVRKRRRLVLLASVALVLTVVVVATQFSPVTDRIQQWAGGEPASTPPEPVVMALPDADDDPADATGWARDDIVRDEDEQLGAESALPRERMLEDPDEIDAELRRRLAEQDREEQTTEEPPESPVRETPRTAPTPRTSVVAEAPRRATPQEPPPEQARQQARQQEQQRPRATQRAAVDPDDTERLERLMRAREARLAEMGSAPDSPRSGDTAQSRPESSALTVATPWSPGGPEYVRVWELPLSIRRNLPDLRLSIHVFAVEEDSRFVLVNGERFVSGDMITDSVRLVDIRREGAVVDFRDYRFLLEP